MASHYQVLLYIWRLIIRFYCIYGVSLAGFTVHMASHYQVLLYIWRLINRFYCILWRLISRFYCIYGVSLSGCTIWRLIIRFYCIYGVSLSGFTVYMASHYQCPLKTGIISMNIQTKSCDLRLVFAVYKGLPHITYM